MANHKVTICCWTCGRETEFVMSDRQEQGLVTKIAKMKAVCPHCLPQNRPIFIKDGNTVFNMGKLYKCEQGHTSVVSPFMGGMLNVQFGNDAEEFVNIAGTIEELPELIDTKEITCHHVGCDRKLLPIDDSILKLPSSSFIKTKTRIGDLWDRNGIEPVRNGHYTQDGYQQTKTEVANRERLNKMRERNVALDRLPGKRINKPTNKTYSRRSKTEVKPDRLNGPK